jgi:hypothetical protein
MTQARPETGDMPHKAYLSEAGIGEDGNDDFVRICGHIRKRIRTSPHRKNLILSDG